MPYKLVCKGCGSDQIKVDAWAEWSINKQEWVLYGVHQGDMDWCSSCSAETTIVKSFIHP